MTDDSSVRSALDALTPPFEDVPGDWDDALRRSESRSTSRASRLAVALAVAVGVLVGLAASPFGQAVVGDTLSELGAWLDDEPGEPPSPEQQRAFEADNAASYASFPTGTRVGVLVRSDFEGEGYTLFGFRDGEALCLRLTPNVTGKRFAPAECVPQAELSRLDAPIAVLVGNGAVSSTDERCATAVYGLATNRVERVTIERPLTGSATVAVGNNAFLSIAEGRDCRSNAATSATAVYPSGQRSTTRIPAFPAKFFNRPTPEELPGPAEIERRLTDGAVGWLERGEHPGQAFDWPSQSGHTMLTSRVLHPDPTMSFRLGAAGSRR